MHNSEIPPTRNARPLKYWCFISYSQKDQTIAKQVQAFLEGYSLPGGLSASVIPPPGFTAQIRPVFRDITHLSATPKLSETLKRALDESANLVVLCSPAAATSPWVEDEVAYFLSLGRTDSIFQLVLAGEPHTDEPTLECLPPSLRNVVRTAGPLLVDLRGGRSVFKLGCLKLVAGLHRLSLDDLVRRHHRRRRRLIAAAVVIVVAVTAGATVGALRMTADRALARLVSDARALEASGAYRAAERTLVELPDWVICFASASTSGGRLNLLSRLSYRAGTDALPPFHLEMEFDGDVHSEIVLSGDGTRIATRESIVTIEDSVKNHWLAVFDRVTGNRVSRLFGEITSTSIVLNWDGTVFASIENGKIVFRSIATGETIADEKVGPGTPIMFPLRAYDRVVQFTTEGSSLNLFEVSTGRVVARISARLGGQVQLLALGEETDSIRHIPALFKSGELKFVDAISGEAVSAAGPSGERFVDLSWVSPERDTVLAKTESGKLALFRGGRVEPVYVTRPPEREIAQAAVLGERRLAVTTQKDRREVIVFNADDGTDVQRHQLPGDVKAIASLGRQSLMAALESGSTNVVIDALDADFELWGQRTSISTAAKFEARSLYAVGSFNGAYVIGQSDSNIILREGKFGKGPIIETIFDPSGRSIELIGGDGNRLLVELLAPRQISSWEVPEFATIVGGDEDRCRKLTLSADGRRLAVRTKTGLALYDNDGNHSEEFNSRIVEESRKNAPAFEFSPSGHWILYARSQQPLELIDSATGRSSEGPVVPDGPSPFDLDACPVSFEGRVFWTGNNSFDVLTYEGRQRWRIEENRSAAPRLILESTDATDVLEISYPLIQELFVSPSGDREVAKEIQGAPILRRHSDGKVIATLNQFGPYADRVVFNADGTRLLIAATLSGSEDDGTPSGGYALIDAISGHVLRTHRAWILNTSRIDFSPDGRFLFANATGGATIDFSDADTSATLVDARNGELIAELTEGFGTRAIDARIGGYADHAFSADGKRLYAVRQSGRLDVWSLDVGFQ